MDITMYVLTNDKPPKEQLKNLTSVISRQEIAEFAQSVNITWKSTDNPNINWMRCSMAIQNNFDIFCNSWNEHLRLQYDEEIAEELAPTIEDESPEYLYCSGDFYPKELLVDSETQFYEGYEFIFLGENTQIEQILNDNSEHHYLFSHNDKIVFLNKIEMSNIYLIECFIERHFEKTFLKSQSGFGNPIKFWSKSQYTPEQQLDKYYLNTVLTYKNTKYNYKFTKTRDGWRYLSLQGKLCWFTIKEMAYIASRLKLVQKQFP
jgi:hypothetical protein